MSARKGKPNPIIARAQQMRDEIKRGQHPGLSYNSKKEGLTGNTSWTTIVGWAAEEINSKQPQRFLTKAQKAAKDSARSRKVWLDNLDETKRNLLTSFRKDQRALKNLYLTAGAELSPSLKGQDAIKRSEKTGKALGGNIDNTIAESFQILSLHCSSKACIRL